MSPRFPLPVMVLALLLGAGLSGCLDSGDDAGEVPAAETPAVNATAENATIDDGTTEMPADIGHQPHMHDYWTGRERVTLMEQDVQVDPMSAAFFSFFNVVGTKTPALGGAFVELPDGAIVYEGTGKLEFTASWSDPAVTGMVLRYRSAASPDFSEPVALQSATPLTIDVTPEMSDMPHEKTSRWSFLLTPGSGQSMVGAFRVKVDILKMRDIEQFPGHPELFGGKNTLTLYEGAAQSSQTSLPKRLADVAVNGFRPESEGIRPTAVVPMETMSMTANVTITNAAVTAGQVSGAWFLYKAADTNQWRLANQVAGDPATGVYQFAWPVEMSQTDSPYADSSQWAFDLRVSTDPAGTGMTCGGCSDAQVDYNLVVVAYDARVEGAGEPESHDDNDN